MSGLARFALVLFILSSMGGCLAKGAQTTSALPAPLQETASQPEERQEVAGQPVRHREFDYAAVLTRDNDFFVTSDDYSGENLSGEDAEHVQDVPSISDIVLAEYEDWRGVRYRSGGSDYRGVDCSGLVQAVFKDAFEMDLPRTSGEQANLGEAVPRDDIQPGDLLYFIDRGRKHVGVAVNEDEFLHASRKKGVILSKFDKYWKPRLKRVRRVLTPEQSTFAPSGG
jgi:cell wall-associated NlpC family hydrolase